MTSATLRLSRVFTATAVAFAAAAPAFAGPAFLKLGDIKGESNEAAASSDKPRIAVLEVHSFSFGVEREMKESGEKGGTEDINIGVGELQEGARANDRLRSAGPKDGWPSAQAGEAEITLKGAAGTGATAGKTPSSRPRGLVPGETRPRPTAAPGAGAGVRVAVGDVTGDGAAAASGLPTGKRQHKPLAVTKPLDKGSVSLKLKSGWDGCRVGTRFAELELSGDGKLYKLSDAVVTSCSGSGSGQQADSVSFNYAKIKF